MSRRPAFSKPRRLNSITVGMILATVLVQDQVELQKKLEQVLAAFQPQLLKLTLEFVTAGASPSSLWEFEKALAELLREVGRKTVEMAIHSIEPEALPRRVWHDGSEFSRKNVKTWQRGGVGSLFGVVELRRYSYEPLAEEREAGWKSFAPLLERLGIVADNATPALAEVVARDAAGHSEEQTLLFLKQGMAWVGRRQRCGPCAMPWRSAWANICRRFRRNKFWTG